MMVIDLNQIGWSEKKMSEPSRLEASHGQKELFKE